ncbi:MAG: heavy metal-responsive transcriptional regulator [Chloroflexi bacterium]|nr:heavy metal-responsive transcriptional regulator [Chloroflexota bacterium]
MADRALLIGELAAALGLNPKTIRYYEAVGLLPEPRRTAAGYRLYGPADLDRLRFIGKAKAIGLSLEEIGDILRLRRGGQAPCEHVLALVGRKLEAVDRQLRTLTEFRQELVALRRQAARTMSAGTADACVCGIIEQHEPQRGAAPLPVARHKRSTQQRRFAPG